MVLVLLTSWLDIDPVRTQGAELQILELFAGVARLARLGTSLGIPSRALDITFDPNFVQGAKSSMDFNEPAGYLSLAAIVFLFWS